MKVARFPFVLALVVAFVTGCGTGIPPAGNYATVSGRVVDAATGAGIANAAVVVNGGVLSAQSDQNGNFRVTPVPTGDWDYVATAAGYASTGLISNPAPLSPGEQRVITISLTHS
jgi:hypothetical protein